LRIPFPNTQPNDDDRYRVTPIWRPILESEPSQIATGPFWARTALPTASHSCDLTHEQRVLIAPFLPKLVHATLEQRFV
jgi:hypothetical protein